MLIVIAEKIRSNPEEEYRRIFDFLGVRYRIQAIFELKYQFFKVLNIRRHIEIEAEDAHVATYENKIGAKLEKKVIYILR